jgi:triacylglycerol lipase
MNNVNKTLNTKYPILLVHGTGFRDDNPVYNYWGRVPKALIADGAALFYGRQDAWGTIENNANTLKDCLNKIIEETKCDKVNIIAHSKGGLEARYMISSLGMDEYVATLTTISTPHYGSYTIDFVCKVPSFILSFIAIFVNLLHRILGDNRPDFKRAVYQFSTKECKKFNEKNVNSENVYYQSYSGEMRNAFSDLLFFFTFLIVHLFEGKNDGLVTVKSAVWGTDKGIISNSKNRGVSHSDLIDLWRMNLSGFDIRKIYINILQDLKAKGY